MKILIVDDDMDFLENAVIILAAETDFEITGTPDFFETFRLKEGWQDLEEKEDLALVRDADVIFLDHNLSLALSGEEFIELWRGEGIPIEEKRIVGISSNPQPYLSESIFASDLYHPDVIKKLLEAPPPS